MSSPFHWGIHRGALRLAALAAAMLLALSPDTGRALDGEVASADVAVRMSKLEADVADLKRTIAELEARLRAKPSLSPDQPGSGGADENLAARVGALETQIGALTNQLEMMRGGTPQADSAPADEPDNEREVMEAFRDAPATPHSAPVVPPAPLPQTSDGSDPTKPRWYGPRPGQDTGEQDTGESADEGPQSILPPSVAGAPADALYQNLAALPDDDAEALYEQAYGALLQRDYSSAETDFSKLVKDYPNDPLAGSAQYWVGETYFVRKQYKKAADSFLAAYRKYSGSDKAPDSLLKLGMSLVALEQKDAACSTFKELNDKFPDAPAHIQSQAKGEASKAGCK